MIYGLRAVEEAVKAGKRFERIFIQNGIKSEAIHDLKRILKEKETDYSYTPVEKMNRLAPGRNHQGVIAMLASVLYADLGNVLQHVFESGEVPLILLLDRITDVRNFGAVCRTAECCGVHGVVIPSRGGAMVGPDSVKTSAGALNRITVCREDDLEKTIHYLKNSGLQIIACTEKGSSNINTADLRKPSAIIIGSEEDGISPELIKIADQVLRIPMLGELGSLNVSVAAGMILYETVRQRTS